MKYLIVCGGNIDKEFACDLIKKSGIDVIIAADSGMDFLYQNGITPDIIVGDFDSTRTKALGYFEEKGQSEIHPLNPVKDDTDAEFAIRTAIERGAKSIIIIGATGSRIDHVLGNISLLGVGLKQGVAIEILDQNNRIRMIDRPVILKKDKQYGKYVSLIPVSSDNEVSLTGFKYPLDHHVFDKYTSLGISNEIMDDEAVIDIHRGVFIVVESRD
ncbi:thiamine diphosphokinase [Agathobacter sp.]